MSVLIPFSQCIARPNDGELTFLLQDHLMEVKNYMERWGRHHPVLHNDPIVIQLLGLSGLCHDVAKATVGWQEYIGGDHDKKQGPPHAPAGAFLFSYLGYKLLISQNKWNSHKRYWLWIARDIADHHGSLKHAAEDNWKNEAFNFRMIDLEGLNRFIADQLNFFDDITISEESLNQWAGKVMACIRQAKRDLVIRNNNGAIGYQHAMKEIQLWRELTTGLIAGDRFDIVNTGTSWFDEKKLIDADRHLDQFCAESRAHQLSSVRAQAQQYILEQLKNNPKQRMYTLEMPTGYGKTITALKIATWLGLNHNYRKIIYVAPYLSILEQTADVIEKAMNVQALEHHSLSIWDEKEHNPERKSELFEQKTPQDQLISETWAHEMVCTSFQQFSKALFPKRAQDTLRRAFLRDSVIIIDEPQIFNPASWNTFLSALECMAEQLNLRVVFLSATMPTFEHGLETLPTRLVARSDDGVERYVIRKEQSMDENELADFIINRPELLQGVIVNTIEDAYLVHQSLHEQRPKAELMLVHGLMAPIHKRLLISKIQKHLEESSSRLIVVSTQVLEAGVDVSFQHIARALPIIPSIVQAAGRLNRHFENQMIPSQLTLFQYLRGGDKDTRSSIYDRGLQSITDELLSSKDKWYESEMHDLIKKYYETMFARNPYTAGMRAIHEAHQGNWPSLSEFEPFGADVFRLPLFVPWQYNSVESNLLSETYKVLCDTFELYTPEDIYEQYTNPAYMKSLSFTERKKFMILFHHYVINIPVRLVNKVVAKEDYLNNKSIPILQDTEAYDVELGLIRHFDDLSLI